MSESFDLSESYDGIAARTWDYMGGDDPQEDHAFYARKIAEGGGKALDLGCGTGKNLLRYVKSGLDVEGVDASGEMLKRCGEKAREQGLNVKLHRQSMQALDLPERYRTIYIPSGTFQLLWKREDAMEALSRFHRHLEPGGRLYFGAFVPWNDLDKPTIGHWYHWGPNDLPDGTKVTTYLCMTAFDRFEQVQEIHRRYEVSRDGRVLETELHSMRLRWYFKHELTMMLERAGFSDVIIHGDNSESPAEDRHDSTIYSAKK